MITQDRPPRAELPPDNTWHDWARDLGERGRRVWGARRDEERRSIRRSGYVAAIVANAIFLAVAHNLLSWHVPFVTVAWADVLWAIDLSVGGSIVANAMYLAYDERWFRGLGQIAVTVLSLVAALAVVQVFPFNFGDPATNDLARFACSMAVFAIGVAIVVQAIVWIVRLLRQVFQSLDVT